jgi:hypothetical protein
MNTLAWLKTLRGHGARHPIRHTARLRLEALEDRSLLSTSPGVAAIYGNLPLAFESNQGQAASQIDFLARGADYTLALTAGNALLGLHHGSAADTVQLDLLGANPQAARSGQDELATKSNYLIGDDPSQWHTNISNYGKVQYENVYSGIDLVYYGNLGRLEYDFVVAAGADPGAIRMSIQGAKSIALDAQGNLVVHTSGEDLVQQAPVVYQNVGGGRRAVAGQFVLEGNNQIGFLLGAYDSSRPLIIDPVLSYSTYLGGSGEDSAQAIAVDGSGNAYITGTTTSANFPTTAGFLQSSFGGASDAFVAKLNASGTGLIYCTYLGGTFDDTGSAIAVDSAGNAYLTGVTSSANFPTTPNAVQSAFNPSSLGMAFVTQLNASGSALLYSTYLGSTGFGGVVDWGHGIAVDASGGVYVAGTTSSTDFITTPGAFQPTSPLLFSPGLDNAFVAKIDPSQVGSASLVYSTYLNGPNGTGESWGDGIAVNASGNAYVTGGTYSSDFPTTASAFQRIYGGGGEDAFLTELNGNGSALVYSTFLGGAGTDFGEGIALDAAGNAYVTGTTQSANFPTTSDAYQNTYGGLIDAFVTKLNPSGSTLVYSTFLGGSNTDEALGIAVDAAGNAYVAGDTVSANLPTTPGALQPTKGGGYDAFFTKLNGSGSALVYSSYLGGSSDDFGNGIAVDAAGNAYVCGETASANLPTTPGALQQTYGGNADASVAKIDPTVSPFFAVSGFLSPNTAGTAGTFTVTAKDSNGGTATSYTGTVHFTSTDTQAILPADYTFTAADAGTHIFSATLKTAGTQSITVTDVTTASMSGAQTGITVQPASASTLVVAGFPSSTTAGVAHSFTVTAKDAYGNTATGYTGTIHFTSSDLQAVLPANYTFTAADSGTHTFRTTLKTAGARSITATDTLLSGIKGSEAGITVNAAAASKFIISAPPSVSAGVAFSLTVTVVDAFGNVATGYTGAVRFTSSDGTATLPSNYTFTAADHGVHTFVGLVMRKKGKQRITVTDTLDSSLTASQTVSVV